MLLGLAIVLLVLTGVGGFLPIAAAACPPASLPSSWADPPGVLSPYSDIAGFSPLGELPLQTRPLLEGVDASDAGAAYASPDASVEEPASTAPADSLRVAGPAASLLKAAAPGRRLGRCALRFSDRLRAGAPPRGQIPAPPGAALCQGRSGPGEGPAIPLSLGDGATLPGVVPRLPLPERPDGLGWPAPARREPQTDAARLDRPPR